MNGPNEFCSTQVTNKGLEREEILFFFEVEIGQVRRVVSLLAKTRDFTQNGLFEPRGFKASSRM